MEVARLVDCFKSPIQNRDLRYTKYIGDGDSKSYLEIVANDSYSDLTLQKPECVTFSKACRCKITKTYI